MGSDGAGDEPMAYPLALSLMGFKCPFWCTLGVPHFMVPDSSPRASGGVGALSLRVYRDLVYSRSHRDCVLLLEVSVGARERTHWV